MEIIIGTYEEFLVGFKLSKKNQKFVLEQSFTNHAHNGSIRAIATSNKYLASGSVDEIIHLINIKHRIETGTLVSHTGTITALEFLRQSYLFSSSEDGSICIWNTQKWQCEKILRGHKGSVTSINLHSSGKLLLSVSKDKTLKTWNLIKGRCAYTVNLKKTSHQVLWSPSCIYFAIVFETHIDIYDISIGAVKYQIDQKLLNFDKRLNKITFTDDNHLIISGDCPQFIIYEIDTKKVINRIKAHKNRIKDLTLINLNTIKDDSLNLDKSNKWLFTISSDGFIKIWSIDFNDLEKQPILISEIDTTCRPTCMAVWTNSKMDDKFDHFTIPKLMISKEELEACKTKLKAKNNSNISDKNENKKIKSIKFIPLSSSTFPIIQDKMSFNNYQSTSSNSMNGSESQFDFPKLAQIVAANVQKISNNVNQLQRMVNQLGTTQDSENLRSQLHQIQHYTNQLARDTSQSLKELAIIPSSPISSEQKQRRMQKERLTDDFSEALKNFQVIQRTAAQKEKESVIRARANSHLNDSSKNALIDLQSPQTIQPPQHQQILQIEEDVDIHLLQEREQAIRKIESDIVEVNQIFKDLATIVHEQGEVIDSIEANIETTGIQIHEGTQQLIKASDYSRRARKKKFIIIMIFLIILGIICTIIYFT